MLTKGTLDLLSKCLTERTSFVKQKNLLLNIALSAALAILYAITAPDFMPDADGPEFVVIGITGGIAHPPGYPFYCILLRMVNFFFADPEAAFAAFGYLSAILSGIAAFLMLDLLTRLGISTLARFAAIGTAFTGFAIWHVSNNIEPFALNLTLCAGVLWCTAALTSGNDQFNLSPRTAIGLLGLLFGLGVCNHHTQALLVPMAAYAITRTALAQKQFAKSCLYFFSGLTLGLLPIAYFYTTNLDAPLSWGAQDWITTPISTLIKHILRKDYGTLSLSNNNDAISRAPFMFQSLAENVLYVGLIFSAIGGWYQLKPRDKCLPSLKFFTECVVICVVMAGLFFFTAKLGTSNFAETIVLRFIALPVMLLTPLIAFGIEGLRGLVSPLASSSLLLAAIIFNLASNLEQADRKHQALLEFTVTTILQITHKGFFIIDSDLTWSGVPFVQVVRRQFQDTRAIAKPFLETTWAREAFFRKWNLPPEAKTNVNDFFTFAIKNGGLYFENIPFGNPITARVFPLGPIFAAVERSNQLPDPEKLFKINEGIYKQLAASPAFNKEFATTGWEKAFLEYFARPWITLEKALRPTNPELASKANEYYQTFSVKK